MTEKNQKIFRRILIGLGIGVRFLWYLFTDGGGGHVQSLILACTLIIIGFLTFMIGLVSDLMASNRRILADTQYHVRRMEYEAIEERKKKAMLSLQRELQMHSCMAKEKALEHAKKQGVEEPVFQEINEIREILNMITMC